VLADYLAALPVEDHHRRGAASAPPARLAECVGREVSSVDGRARHGAPSHRSRRRRASRPWSQKRSVSAARVAPRTCPSRCY